MNQKRTVSVLLALIVSGFVVLGVVPGTSVSAAALNPGSTCPPQFSVCNPSTLALIAQLEGQTVAAGAVTTGAAATTGTAAMYAGTATAVVGFMTGIAAGEFLWGADAPPELPMPEGIDPGWVGNVSTTTHSYSGSYGVESVTVQVRVVSAPDYLQNGVVTIAQRCVAYSGNSGASFPVIRIEQASGTHPTVPMRRASGCAANPGWTVSTATVTGGLVEVESTGQTPLIRWYPEGRPGRSSGEAAGEGTVVTRMKCIDADEEVATFTTTQVVTYAALESFTTPALDCPPGSVLYGFEIGWIPSGEGTEYEIVPWTPSPEWVWTAPTEFPGCVDPAAPCELRLFKQTPNGLEYCGVAATGCLSWWLDPAKLENYQCMWGAYSVELGYCNVFRTPGTVKPNTPAQQDPKNGVWYSPGLPPDTGLDPLEPIAEPLPPTAPAPVPVPSPGSPPDPTPLPSSGECFPQGWGVFNPVEWVYKPIKCAFVWAFIPSGPLDTEPIGAAFESTVLGSITDFLGDAQDVFAGYSPGSEACGVLLDVELDTLRDEPLVVTTCQPIIQAVSPFIRFSLMALIWIGTALLAITVVGAGFDLQLGLAALSPDDKQGGKK